MKIQNLVCVATVIIAAVSQSMTASQADDTDASLVQLKGLWANLSESDRAQFRNFVNDKTAQLNGKKARSTTNVVGAVKAPPIPAVAAPNSSKLPAVSNSIFGNCPGLGLILRKSWTDIDLGACPQPVAKATGAVLSYSNDQIKHNTVWTAQGTAALIYAPPISGPNVFSAGVYTSLNKITNSSGSLATSNVDTVGYGGFLQYGFINATDQAYSANYFRVRAGATDDNLKGTTSAHVIAEWIPVYDDGSLRIHSPIPIPGTPALIRFDPELVGQFVEATGPKNLTAFNNRHDALPIGPQLTVRLYPGTSDFWSHFVPSVSYWWAYEPYSARTITWLDASLAYNLDKDGHLALSVSYERGNNIDTAGTLTNMYLLSLSAKL